MTHLELETVKSRLLKMQSDLDELDLVAKASTGTVVLDQSSVGRLSRMDALQGQQMALEAERRRKQEKLQIRAALARIQNGEFGLCASCGDEIGVGRLSVNPIAARCIKCTD